MRMLLPSENLSRAFTHPRGVFATGEAAVVEEELEQSQIVVPQVPTEEEIPSQPTVEILGQRTRPDGPAADSLDLFGEREVMPPKDVPECGVPRPATGVVGRIIGNREQLPDQRRIEVERFGQGGQGGVEFGGEGEQVVALTLQIADQLAEVVWGRGHPGVEFGPDEIVQLNPVGMSWASQSQDIVSEPVGQQRDLVGPFDCSGFVLGGSSETAGQDGIRRLTAACDLPPENIACFDGPIGSVFQEGNDVVDFLESVEDITAAGNPGEGRS
jgi:hypothetical protein